MEIKVIACLIALAFTYCQSAAEEASPLDSFTSKAAIDAVAEYRQRDQFLIARLNEEREKEQAKLATALKLAIETATKQGDFGEVGRLSSYLDGQPGGDSDRLPEDQGKERPLDKNVTASLQAEVAELKREIARRNASEPKFAIRGQWMRSDGTVFSFNRDGTFVASPGKPGVLVKDMHKAGFFMQCPGYLFMFYPKEGKCPRYYPVTNETVLVRSDRAFTLTYVGK